MATTQACIPQNRPSDLGSSKNRTEDLRTMTREENVTLVRRLVDSVINGRQLNLVDQLFVPELAEAVLQGFRSFITAFPDWREEVVDMVAEDDKIAVRFRCSGTLQGEFMGVAPNGRRHEVDEVFFLRVRNGRFVEYWGLEDNVSRLRQLGAIS